MRILNFPQSQPNRWELRSACNLDRRAVRHGLLLPILKYGRKSILTVLQSSLLRAFQANWPEQNLISYREFASIRDKPTMRIWEGRAAPIQATFHFLYAFEPLLTKRVKTTGDKASFEASKLTRRENSPRPLLASTIVVDRNAAVLPRIRRLSAGQLYFTKRHTMNASAKKAQLDDQSQASLRLHTRTLARQTTTPAEGSPRTAVISKLSREVEKLTTSGRQQARRPAISTGCAVMDTCLPAGGYTAGSVIEYLRRTPACGASYLAFLAAASAMRATNGFLVVVDNLGHFYPPLLASFGIDLAKVVFVRPDSQADMIWTIDQSLRTPAVAAVICEIIRLDDRSARRLQLAAERGGGLALLLRSAAARNSPSWAEVQWLVGSLPQSSPVHNIASSCARHLHVQLAKVRGGRPGRSLQLEIDAQTGNVSERRRVVGERKTHAQKAPTGDAHRLRLASQLAHPARRRRAERA